MTKPTKPRPVVRVVVDLYPATANSYTEAEWSDYVREWLASPADYRRPRVVSVKVVRPKPPTKAERAMIKKARVPRTRQRPCFSCVDKDARYADGLCEACHRVATAESERTLAASENEQ